MEGFLEKIIIFLMILKFSTSLDQVFLKKKSKYMQFFQLQGEGVFELTGPSVSDYATEWAVTFVRFLILDFHCNQRIGVGGIIIIFFIDHATILCLL